ncbi:FBP domain-containing protein [Microbacterium aurum]|uniref:FBP domain-containing protein n=1 Tax=Microbacterium aurum TaxID=36805 RepID=UPI001EF4B3A5|nr:FBP domain-containing protein [Microbacterium aurum]MCG7413054.1 FBP domain-containing protein [Microbacterium aurum]
MHSLDAARIRASFANVTLRERKTITLPDLDAIRWDRIDFLGWRDPKLPLVGWVVAEIDGEPVGLMLKQTESTPRQRTQCAWCVDVRLPNDVVLFSTRRAGAAGRRGDAIGTLICAAFECNVNVRRKPPVAYVGFDVEAARRARIETLRGNVERFVRDAIADS